MCCLAFAISAASGLLEVEAAPPPPPPAGPCCFWKGVNLCEYEKRGKRGRRKVD